MVGSNNSSNSNRLVEVARNFSASSHLIDSYRDIRPEWLEGVKTVALDGGCFGSGVSGGRSGEVFGQPRAFANVKEVEVMPENVRFGLPPEIVEAIASAPAASAAAD